MEVFWEIHRGLPQEGPGCEESTLQALSLLAGVPAWPRILDVGCGPGRQTLTLARHTGGHVLAVDTHQPYLDQVAQRASREGLAERITTRNCSMTEMDSPDQSFDLIWSEGAIYIMGFEKGLQAWKRFLKPKGSLAVTELSWLTNAPPGEAKQFFDETYPVMKTVAQNLETIRSAGYVSSPHFVLPPSAWWDNYYTPMEARVAELRKQYAGNAAALKDLDAEQREIDVYRRYSDAYGYVFYLMEKP
jgi:ubiquinone/menaquinone biosynthesis C-methylase UbiE